MNPDIPRPLPRRVLIVHNWHRSGLISGENRVVEADTALLRDAGVEVEIYSRSNDETNDFSLTQWAEMSFRPIVSISDARGLRAHIDRFKPDIVHIHNVVPLISPWVVRTARAARVPIVHTVHNYLHACVAASYFRDGHPCFDCKGRTIPWPAAVHGCSSTKKMPGFVGDRMKSAVLATSLAVHRPTWKLVDRFLPVGSAVARHLEEIGIDASKITVRGNPVADPGPPSPPGNGGALFAGRLAREKGPHLLLAAWERSGLGAQHRLRFVGDGREEDLIKQSARDIPGVEFLGHVEHARALELMEESSFVVVPSMWDEPFGLAVVEAMARGRPVLVTKLGEPAEMVRPGTGWVADPTVDAFAHALRDAFVSPLDEIGRNARRRYEERYAPAVALRTLLDAYSDVLEKRPAGSAATAE